jgi:integrase
MDSGFRKPIQKENKKMDMARVEDWLSAIPSKYTRKTYKSGIRKFEQFYKKPIEDLLNLSDEETGHIVEKFYACLKDRGHGQNTCRNLINSPLQYLKYFGKNPKYRRALGMYKTVLTTRDHLTTIFEIQELAKVGDLREQILLEVFLLGLRVRDVSELKWQSFAVNGEPPIPIFINTKKEEVTAQTFISEEFKGLLDKYLPTLDKSNPYLFQSKKWTKKRKGIQNLGTKQIENVFKGLVKKAGINTHGVMAWHSGRKLFLRTATELGISPWSAKLMCGKSVPASDDAYIHNVELKPDFLKVSEVLRLFPKNVPHASDRIRQLEDAMTALEKENIALKTRIEVMQKQSGLTEKALADLIRPLLVQVLRERSEKKGIPSTPMVAHSLGVCASRKLTSREIIQTYVKVKEEMDRFYSKRSKQTGKGREIEGKLSETMLKNP